MLKIAVLSGKGGTGKTTVAASLAQVLPQCGYVDCDVEEPNGFLFLEPKLVNNRQVEVLIPEIDKNFCTLCGECVRICQFNALAKVKDKIIVFPELCHHCGACALVCKPMAITEVERSIGTLSSNQAYDFFQGKLDIGEPSGIPIIDQLKKELKNKAKVKTAILDCPPGASCSVVASLEDCDYALLVTEPTPFGLNDLKITAQLVKEMNLPAGVILNKSGQEDHDVELFCQEINLPILLKIPYSRKIAADYARGLLPVAVDAALAESFKRAFARISAEVGT